MICSANQWTGFCMTTASVMKELMVNYNSVIRTFLCVCLISALSESHKSSSDSKSNRFSIFSNEKCFVGERQMIKTFESCRFHDLIIDGFKCFYRARQIVMGKFKTVGNFNIILSVTSNKCQAMFLLNNLKP